MQGLSVLLNNLRGTGMVIGMKHNMLLAFLAVLLSANASAAACYADYKAKQENPLRLHYGVAALSGACSKNAATQELADRLAQNGWTLLNIVSVFEDDGLPSRKDNAGQYYLRF